MGTKYTRWVKPVQDGHQFFIIYFIGLAILLGIVSVVALLAGGHAIIEGLLAGPEVSIHVMVIDRYVRRFLE